MEHPLFSNPLESWLPFQLAFIVGLVVCIRTYMKGPECPSDNKIAGKKVIITGGNSGIGKQTALELARRGGTIILGCRNTTEGEETVAEIIKLTGNKNVAVLHLDLASFNSVRHFVKEYNHKYDALDVLINNAGVMCCPFSKTGDGNETHFQVNHLSHFLLTNLLLDKLKEAPFGRIINVSALAHKAAGTHFDDPNLENNYSEREAYGHSKLAQLLFTHHLSKQLEGTRVTVNAVHPGIVKNTNLLRYTAIHNSIFQKLATPLTWLLLKTPKDGAQTLIYLSVAPEVESINGKYFSDCQIAKSSLDAVNDEFASQMWNLSSKLVGLKI